jgi:hypothetical protein
VQDVNKQIKGNESKSLFITRPLAKMFKPHPNPLLTKAPIVKGREPDFSCFPP